MIVLSTTEAPASPNETAWLYNGIDSAVTKEIYEALLPQVMEDDNVAYTYSRSMEKVGLVLEMSLRGYQDQRGRVTAHTQASPDAAGAYSREV